MPLVRRLPAATPMRATALAILLLASVLPACITGGYVVQASLGQLELWGRARSIRAVLADDTTDERTKVLLREVAPIRRFAADRGLASQGNYEKFVELNRDAVVWFMAASRELAFEPKLWSFPIVGSFPYLGWFDWHEAQTIRRLLQRERWDVHIRPVHAYSTGGWFRDPVLSTMLSQSDDALRGLANVLFHELTHANILINNQSTFNESIASFVGDTMAEEYLVERFGEHSAEVEAFRTELAEDRMRGERFAAAYRDLSRLYESDAADDQKRQAKARILSTLELELGLPYAPNNGTLIGFKTYNAGLPEMAALYRQCGASWQRFFAAIDTLGESSFRQEQEEDIGPVIAALTAQGCPSGASNDRARSRAGARYARHQDAAAHPVILHMAPSW